MASLPAFAVSVISHCRGRAFHELRIIQALTRDHAEAKVIGDVVANGHELSGVLTMPTTAVDA